MHTEPRAQRPRNDPESPIGAGTPTTSVIARSVRRPVVAIFLLVFSMKKMKAPLLHFFDTIRLIG